MKVSPGDIVQGDCLDVMSGIAPESVDMILCDLPYGTTKNKWDSVIPFNRLWEHYNRIIKPGGVIALNSQGAFTARLILSNEKHFKYKLAWVKAGMTGFLNAKKQPLRKHEDICIFYNGKPVYNPVMFKEEPYTRKRDGISKSALYSSFKLASASSDGERYPLDVFYCKGEDTGNRKKLYHNTQKPVSLGRYLIRTYTNPGDVVLDNAFGSGSYLVAAAMEGRQYIGIEKNDSVDRYKGVASDMIDIAKMRLAEVERMKLEGIAMPDIFDDIKRV